MSGRLIAIGDVHGCHRALQALLDAVAVSPQDTIVTLGDYVDRGPGSRQVMERMLELQQQCRLVPLLGNHERMMLDAHRDASTMLFWLQVGGQETLDSYGGSLRQIPETHFEFLRACRLDFESERHLFVHANYDPTLPLGEQPESLRLWTHLVEPSIPGPHVSGKRVVLGHTPQRSGEVLDLGHLACIDTFCFGGKWLTALDVDSGRQWQADDQGNLRRRADEADAMPERDA